MVFIYDPSNPSAYAYDNSLAQQKSSSDINGSISLYVCIPIIFVLLVAIGIAVYVIYRRQQKLLNMVNVEKPASASKVGE